MTQTLGPIAAVIIARGFSFKPEDATAGHLGLQAAGVFFFAGMSPKTIAVYIGEAVKRLGVDPNRTPCVPNTKPLCEVAGVSQEIESRLNEEGLDSAHALAYVNPYRLLRNTPFDKRQILALIDDALLLSFMPEMYKRLKTANITGAIDLASLFSITDQTKVDAVATAMALPDVERAAFRQAVERLYYDAQVQLIWALYQVGGSQSE